MDRFLSKIDFEDTGCWEWTAGRDSHGYGVFWLDGHTVGAHRVSYALFTGPIPDGLELDHLCRNRGCVNPAHLEAVTGSVNTLRGDLPAVLKARSGAKAHCVHGHEYTPETTYVSSTTGVRTCKICRRERDRLRGSRRRAA